MHGSVCHKNHFPTHIMQLIDLNRSSYSDAKLVVQRRILCFQNGCLAYPLKLFSSVVSTVSVSVDLVVSATKWIQKQKTYAMCIAGCGGVGVWMNCHNSATGRPRALDPAGPVFGFSPRMQLCMTEGGRNSSDSPPTSETRGPIRSAPRTRPLASGQTHWDASGAAAQRDSVWNSQRAFQRQRQALTATAAAAAVLKTSPAALLTQSCQHGRISALRLSSEYVF